MRDPDRVGALIIQNGRLLMVTGHDGDYYWTPGGKVDAGEDQETALRRELTEELGVTVEKLSYYSSAEYTNQHSHKLQTSYYYLVEISGELKPTQEITDYLYVDVNDLPPISQAIRDVVIPKLLADGLI